MSLKRQYEEIGKDYIEGQSSFFSKREDWARTFLKQQLVPLQGKVVLDLGCGHGPDILAYESMGAIVYGIDASDYMVGEARKRVPHPERVLLADIEKLPFPDSMFDVVVSRFGFHYLEDLDEGYAEAARVLKKGGLLALIMPSPMYNAVAEGQDYNGKFVVSAPLFGGRVTVRYPHHTTQEFFSPLFTSLFSVSAYGEYKQEEASASSLTIPSALAYAAIKR